MLMILSCTKTFMHQTAKKLLKNAAIWQSPLQNKRCHPKIEKTSWSEKTWHFKLCIRRATLTWIEKGGKWSPQQLLIFSNLILIGVSDIDRHQVMVKDRSKNNQPSDEVQNQCRALASKNCKQHVVIAYKRKVLGDKNIVRNSLERRFCKQIRHDCPNLTPYAAHNKSGIKMNKRPNICYRTKRKQHCLTGTLPIHRHRQLKSWKIRIYAA